MIKKLISISFLLILFACAKPTVTNVMLPGDAELDCGQLKNAYAEANRFIREAKEVKGVTGGNTARALIFWPAIIGSYQNANEAIAAANSRKVHLMNIMEKKECANIENLKYQ
tara:strand:- start:106 stop:444 length:339 start_codon:yes stop_codon:yes gene_type:complete